MTWFNKYLQRFQSIASFHPTILWVVNLCVCVFATVQWQWTGMRWRKFCCILLWTRTTHSLRMTRQSKPTINSELYAFQSDRRKDRLLLRMISTGHWVAFFLHLVRGRYLDEHFWNKPLLASESVNAVRYVECWGHTHTHLLTSHLHDDLKMYVNTPKDPLHKGNGENDSFLNHYGVENWKIQ